LTSKESEHVVTEPTTPPVSPARPADAPWDPRQYAVFAGHRGRPFADLLARVDADDPRLVVDLGCGPGELTLGLAQRWPNARVVGVDSSPDMLARARELDVDGRVEWVEAAAEDWDPTESGGSVDVLVTNATLQWVPSHLRLIPSWVAALAPGGTFAMQVPSNFDAPSHRLMREVAARHARADDLRPVLGVLDEKERDDFVADYEKELEAAYPRKAYGVIFPFTRTFAVARTPA
jgi:trans-aconitate 2-methyltransferase